MSAIDDMVGGPFDGLGGSLEQKVQELADREEIRDLVARYAQRVSRRQSPGDMFVDDGELVVRLPGHPEHVSRGRAALDAMFEASNNRPSRNMPAVHNHVISVAGDTAIGTSWIELHITDANSADDRAFAGSGYYEDMMRRENGRWKFVRREAEILAVGAVQKANPITK